MTTAERKPAGIGESPLRKEDPALIAGQGRFVDDLKLPSMAHAAFTRSPQAHATIVSIDTAAAEAMPGVVMVLTAETLGLEGGVPCASNPTGDAIQPKHPLLAEGKVRLLGEPVAMVVAETAAQARDAADRVDVTYEALPVVVHAEDAVRPGAPQLHDEAPDNICCVLRHKTDGFDEALASADVTVTLEIDNQRLTPVSIEPRAVLADWRDATDEVTLWTSTQVPHFVKTFIAVVCGTTEAKTRVIAPDVGGGFGCKLNTYREEYLTAQASRLSRRPVKWIEARSENMLATTHGRDMLQHVTLGATREGRLVALRVEAWQNAGAYLQLLTPSIPHLALFMMPGAYDLQQVDITISTVFTNTTPTDAYRGAGRPEAAHMIERIVDRLADELDMDPAELRRRNFITEFPYASATGLSYDSGNYAGALERALEISGYAEFESRRQEARGRGKLRGIGLSTYVEVCGLAPSAVTKAIGIGAPGWGSSAVRIHPTGTATVTTGSSPHGQGHHTTWAQIVETELGIPFEDVEVLHGDTAQSPYGLGTYGSRSLPVDGTALFKNLGKIREQARKIAAHELECAPDDLEWGEGVWRVKGSPDQFRGIKDLAASAWTAASLPDDVEPNLEATTFFDPPNFVFPFGTHVCEVEIDPDTGSVEIERYVAVDDCGNVINPTIVEGQLHGGIAQGIAQALYEETCYDESGQLLTSTLVDYMIPGAPELPRFELERTTTPSPTNPMGVKGIGEAGTIAASVAVVNAAVDAVSHLGIQHLEMPLQPYRVWQRLQDASPEGPSGGGAA